jgi:hypothetical protein
MQIERLEEVLEIKTERVKGEVRWWVQENKELFHAVRRPPEAPVVGIKR